MCTRHRTRWARCEVWRAFQERAYQEWAGAETLEAVRASWGRFGGLVTAHRHGNEHYAELGRRSGLARRR